MYYIYKITNQLNGKIYIGQTVNDKKRWVAHKSYSKQDDPVQYIHRAMAKYGIDNFQYEIIDFAFNQWQTDCLETNYIQQFDSRNKEKGYNRAPGGNIAWESGLPPESYPMYGKHHTEESKRKISESNMGKKNPHTEEWSKQISIILTGHIVTPEARQKMSDAQRGVPRWTDEQKQQMSISRTGKIISQETKDKMSLVKLGKKKTQETRARMSKARRIFSDEQELEIVRLRNSGMSASSLAKLYKCSKFPIYNILKRHN